MAQALELLLACLIVGPCLAFLPQEKVGILASGFALALLAGTKSWVGAGDEPSNLLSKAPGHSFSVVF